MEELIKECGLVMYLIKCEPDKYCRLDFEVWKVNSWTMQNEPSKDDQVIFLKGHIKWDGDAHLNFNYLYLSGRKGFEDVKKVLNAVWEKAEKEITNFDKDVANG